MKSFKLLLVMAILWPFNARAQDGFEAVPLSKALLEEMERKGVFGTHSPVPAERLRLVRVQHYDFEEKVRTGQLVVLAACSEQVLNIFKELHSRRFPVHQMELVTSYHGDDSLSMAANNTSAHNLRPVTGGSRFSLHAYGAAIDLNPVQNPYVDIRCDDKEGIAHFQPAAGIHYANRHQDRPGRPKRKGMAEDVVEIFGKYGFYTWGGYWNCPIDYQHFQLSRSLTELLMAMSPEEAKQFFQKVVSYYNDYHRPLEDRLTLETDRTLMEFYQEETSAFYEAVSKITKE